MYKKLNEEINRILEKIELEYEHNRPVAKIDVAGLFEQIKPAEKGFITFEEAKRVKDFLGLTGEETRMELTGIRNAIVRYYADIAETFYEIPRKDHTQEELDNMEVIQDQMSAFTAVIDSMTMNMQEAFTKPKVIGKIVEYSDGFNIQDEHNANMLVKNYPSLKRLLQDLASNM